MVARLVFLTLTLTLTTEHDHDFNQVWWLASQCGAEQGQLVAPPPAGIADEALEEWLSWFARDPPAVQP